MSIIVVFSVCESSFVTCYQIKVNSFSTGFDVFLSLLFLLDTINFIQRAPQESEYKQFHKMTHVQHAKIGVGFINSIPVDLLISLFEINPWFRAIRALRIFRLVRTARVFSVTGNLTVIPFAIRMLLIFTSAISAIHVISCYWHFIQPAENSPTITDQYVDAVYWAITTLTTVGYGDITPSTNLAKLFTMSIMVLGVGVYGFVIGNIAQILGDRNRYKEKAREKIEEIGAFMSYYRVPRKIQAQTLDYLNDLLAKRLTENDQQIISDLPQAIQDELVTYMNIKLIKSLSIFNNCSAVCLKDVANKLQKKSFAPGSYIIKEGEIGNELFIINHGFVEVQKDKKVIIGLDDGKFFGERALINESKRTADVVAVNYCDLYVLSKEDFESLIKRYPVLLENIKKLIGYQLAA